MVFFKQTQNTTFITWWWYDLYSRV